ncbi:MAG: YfhO family protein [Limisphaerales bacterium]
MVICGVPPLPILLRALPILRDVNEGRLLLIVGLSLAVLAGFGWDELFSRTRNQRRTVIVTVGFCALVGVALYCFWRVTGAGILTLDASHWVFLRRQFLILAAGMIVVLLSVLWPLRWNGSIPTVLCLGWTAIDLLCFGTGYNPSISRDLYYPRTPAITWLQNDESHFRIFAGGRMLTANSAEVFGLSDARGCDFMGVRRYEELITGHAGEFFFYRDPKTFPGNLPLLNVKYLLSAKPLVLSPLLVELVYSKEILIYRYKQCLDRAFPVFDYEVEPDRAAALARVSSAEFDPRQTLLLEDQPPSAKMSAREGAVGTNAVQSVRIISYEPDDVRIDASLPRPGFLLLLDTYFPGWSATVNGEPAPILRADYNFRAVSLPAGRSTVSFSYRPESFRIGLYLCAVGILGLAVGWLLPWLSKPGGKIPGAT